MKTEAKLFLGLIVFAALWDFACYVEENSKLKKENNELKKKLNK